MNGMRRWTRQVTAASKTDAALSILKVIAALYQVGFTLYLPVSKYSTLPQVERYRWFLMFVGAFLYLQAYPYLPKSRSKRWESAETMRLRTLNVAISQMTGCIREERFGDTDFLDISGRILAAVRSEVEALVVDAEGIYINATLMVEDEARNANLRVLNRAGKDRPNPSYPKEKLEVWKAMQGRHPVYVPDFNEAGKDYRSILALPIIIEEESGTSKSIGVISIDSGRSREFDGREKQLELKLLPYVSLLKLLLSLRQRHGGNRASSH